MTLASRIFGFARDMLLARILGAGAVADAWQVAFQLPNIFRRLFAEGAFSVAFVPLFNRAMSEGGDGQGKDDTDENISEENRDNAQKFVDETISIFVPILIAFSLIFMLAMPGFVWLIAEEFRGNPEKFNLAVALGRIAFPYLAFISMVALMTGILNSLSKFAAPAAAPILLNICMIGALLLGAQIYGLDNIIDIAYVLAWGVALAGVAQFFWLYYWVRRSQFHIRLMRPTFSPQVKELGILILPAVFGAGIYQISRFVDLFFLGRLPEGSFTYLALADRLNQLPLGIIGIALGTAILPSLSRFIARDDAGGAQRIQSNAVELGLLITLPAAFALFILAGPLVQAIFQGGNFSADDVATTSLVVSALVMGLPAYVLLKVLSPGFFARKDTKTPVYSAAASLAINITLNILLIPILGVMGLALAGAISAWCNCAILYILLHRRGHFWIERDLFWRIAKIILSCLVMVAVLYAVKIPLAGYYDGGVFERILSILALVLAGSFAYGICAFVTGAIDRRKIAMMLGKAKPVEK